MSGPRIIVKRGNVTLPLRAAWRKRLAVTLWRFKRLRGYWPDWQIIAAAHSGMEQAIAQGMQPPVDH